MDARGSESAAAAAAAPHIRQRKPHDQSTPEASGKGREKLAASGSAKAGGSQTWLAGDELKGLICMALLAVQYALQPVVSKRFIHPAVNKTTVVLVCELCKIIFAFLILLVQGPLAPRFAGWSVGDALLASALPAAIYAIQNVLVQSAYPHLDPLTLSMLNQTKLLFTALFTALLLGQRQSGPQVVALLCMLVAAVLLSWDPAAAPTPSGEQPPPDRRFFLGVLPMLVASVLSGLASTVCQRTLQVRRRDAYVMTMEMSVLGIAVLLLTLAGSDDGARIRSKGFFHAWELSTMYPVLLYAAGGILVGLVTKYVGGLKKGFAIVVALLVTAVIQLVLDQEWPTGPVVVAMPLVAGGVLLHSMYPHKQSSKRA
ncbi:Nucleotide-sugar transporter [Klebsormidium nitens]|uniref:Nucleotide-sugar transporter n=1 Tax=Klebsormidium nitens TaxID=105231 RepID=A0A1Y1HM62_KLENI|nr:Nucleotide-sugar transporter [Klebsormidium nitens]|eukprot:GAQ79083.1 Nucleotide-sugar transporter [Klebsormidium nitens]